MAKKEVFKKKGGEKSMGKLKIKNHTKGLGPLSVFMGSNSYSAEGKNGKKGWGWTKKAAVDNYNKKCGGRK